MLDYKAPATVLADRVVLVTGAGDGIGREAARTFAAHGATVILLGKTVKKLEAVYDEIVQAGHPQPAIVPLDLKGATEQHYRDMAATIEREFGRLDGLLHNAALLGVLTPLQSLEPAVWQDLMQVNVTAELLLTQAVLPLLQQADSASVIFTSSSVGRKGRALWGAYAISKFAVEGMMQVFADEFEQKTVRFNSVNPGATRTRMRASAYPAEDANRLKTPADLMPLYLYLMGPDSRDVNGQQFDAQPK